MPLRLIVVLFVSLLLNSCAEIAVKENQGFKLAGRDYLYKKNEWRFSGRMAVSDQNESLSASISWKHFADKDDIELSGFLGQGRTRIELMRDEVFVDDGEQRLHYQGNVHDLVADLLGIAIPVSALKFWVRGLVFPGLDYLPDEQGFVQSEWQVRFTEMQAVGQDDLPRKISLKNEKSKTKVKLVINQWD